MQDKIKECNTPPQQDNVKLCCKMGGFPHTPGSPDPGLVCDCICHQQDNGLDSELQRADDLIGHDVSGMHSVRRQDNGLEEWTDKLVEEMVESSYKTGRVDGAAAERAKGQQDYARNLGAACTKAGITITDLADYEGVVKAIQNSEEAKFEESLNVLYQKHQRELQDAVAAEKAKWVEMIYKARRSHPHQLTVGWNQALRYLLNSRKGEENA